MRKLLLLFLLLLAGTGLASAETWTPVGQVDWTEGMLTGWSAYYGKNFNKTWKVSVERSDTRPGVYRMQPYSKNPLGFDYDNVYAILHTENPNEIYFEYFVYCRDSWDAYYFHIFQRCPENGSDSRYYGKITADNTIEFPIGSFCVANRRSGSASSFPSDGMYSECVHKIVFPDGVLGYTPEPENWVKIGQGYWEDPLWSVSDTEPLSGYTDMEKSTRNPGKYRFSITSSVYVTIHAEDANKVYVEPYTLTAGGTTITVKQMCPENGQSENYYGQLINGQVEMSGNYFRATNESTGQTVTLSDDRRCLIIFPDGFDNPLPEDNGIFMGIVGFNDELTVKPISLLNQDSKNDFTSFVDNLQMGNATLLYYAVDDAISRLSAQTFPENLSNVVLITFTDGLDQGSLAMKPEHRTSRGYASYLADRIAGTSIQGHPLEAYAIGLKSTDVYDDDLFIYNLQSLASAEANISPVGNIAEMQQRLTTLFENLNRQTTQRVVQIKVPMMSHGDKYRFTLDHTSSNAENSEIWFEGDFNIDDMSLENVVYHGFTSASGVTVNAKQEGIKLLFTLEDCRTPEGEILDVDKDGIDQWQFIASRNIWNHNIENAKAEDIDIQNIKSSVAIIFALDCSTSLGDLFPLVKTTANSFISRLAGDDELGVNDISVDRAEELSICDPDVEIYNLQGIRVENPGPGLYILRKGNQIQKVVVR